MVLVTKTFKELGIEVGSGGTSHVLPNERQKASFDVAEMGDILHGGKKGTAKRAFLHEANEDAEFYVYSERPRVENVTHAVKNFLDVHMKHFKAGYKPAGPEIGQMAEARTSASPQMINWTMFSTCLRSQASLEQQEWWLKPSNVGKIFGAYAQTELSHGSNVRGLETTATYDPATEEWIMHSPTLGSIKWWSTGLPVCTHAMVNAQLILNGEKKGTHFFLVQVRDENLNYLPGVFIGDVGQTGETSSTVGFMKLDHVRIPRRHLLERRQHVTPEGQYVMGPHPGSMGTKKLVDKQISPKMQQALKYITMLKTRVGLSASAAVALSIASTITARYSCVRYQGFGEDGVTEMQVIDYANQRYRVLKWISTAYAFKFVTKWTVDRTKQLQKAGEVDLGDLPEVHAVASGVKGVCCADAADGIEDLRRACGGHGFAHSSGIAALESEMKGKHTTGEGDYILLCLQTARFLVKSIRAAKKGEPLVGLTKAFEPLKDPNYDPFSQARASLPEAHSALELTNPDFLLGLYKARSVLNLVRVTDKLDHDIQKAGLSATNAWNRNATSLYNAAKCHVYYFILDKFKAVIDTVQDENCKNVLNKLCCLYGLTGIVEGQGWIGIVTPRELSFVEDSILSLCEELRSDVIALTDSFAIPDRTLNSTLGRYDGNVYEAIYAQALMSAINNDENGNFVQVPAFWDACRQYLDTDMLKLRNKIPAAKL